LPKTEVGINEEIVLLAGIYLSTSYLSPFKRTYI